MKPTVFDWKMNPKTAKMTKKTGLEKRRERKQKRGKERKATEIRGKCRKRNE